MEYYAACALVIVCLVTAIILVQPGLFRQLHNRLMRLTAPASEDLWIARPLPTDRGEPMGERERFIHGLSLLGERFTVRTEQDTFHLQPRPLNLYPSGGFYVFAYNAQTVISQQAMSIFNQRAAGYATLQLLRADDANEDMPYDGAFVSFSTGSVMSVRQIRTWLTEAINASVGAF